MLAASASVSAGQIKLIKLLTQMIWHFAWAVKAPLTDVALIVCSKSPQPHLCMQTAHETGGQKESGLIYKVDVKMLLSTGAEIDSVTASLRSLLLWLIMLPDGDAPDVGLCFAAPVLKTLDEYSSRCCAVAVCLLAHSAISISSYRRVGWQPGCTCGRGGGAMNDIDRR